MKILLTLLMLLTANAYAAVYKTINSNGDVVYSDTQTPGSERLKLPELPTYKPPPVTTRSKPSRTAAENDFYDDFTFIKPEPDETVRNNLGIVMIQATLEPALLTRLRHKIQFYLDGKPHGIPIDRASVTMSNLDRGQHSISASVVNQQGLILISTVDTTVHVKRESVLHEKDVIDPRQPNIPRDDLGFTNPGFRTENPNILSPNPNVRSQNPNVRSQNPNIINPPRPTPSNAP